MTRQHRVTYAIDSLDPAPVVMDFDSEGEAVEWLADEIERRVSHTVQHCAHHVSESYLESLREIEASLARLEPID